MNSVHIVKHRQALAVDHLVEVEDTMKYEYFAVIQGNFGQGWEDISIYATDSNYHMRDKTQIGIVKHDIQEYRASSQGIYRVIYRRVRNINNE